jgi:hypothetical protein
MYRERKYAKEKKKSIARGGVWFSVTPLVSKMVENLAGGGLKLEVQK